MAYIRRIDDFGGMVSAIEKGYPQREIAASAYRFQRQPRGQSERIMVGVNGYVSQADSGNSSALEDRRRSPTHPVRKTCASSRLRATRRARRRVPRLRAQVGLRGRQSDATDYRGRESGVLHRAGNLRCASRSVWDIHRSGGVLKGADRSRALFERLLAPRVRSEASPRTPPRTSATIRRATVSACRTQSGIPTPSSPLPAMWIPGNLVETCAEARHPRATWPTAGWGVRAIETEHAREKRYGLESHEPAQAGQGEAHEVFVVVRGRSTSSPHAPPPKKTRMSTFPFGARCFPFTRDPCARQKWGGQEPVGR